MRQDGPMIHLIGLSQSPSPRVLTQKTTDKLALPCRVDLHLRRGIQRVIEDSGQIVVSQRIISRERIASNALTVMEAST